MTRLADDALAIHLEVALAGAAPELLDGLVASDRHQRHVAVTAMADHLAQRLRCFTILNDDGSERSAQPSLFPDDLGPMG